MDRALFCITNVYLIKVCSFVAVVGDGSRLVPLHELLHDPERPCNGYRLPDESSDESLNEALKEAAVSSSG